MNVPGSLAPKGLRTPDVGDTDSWNCSTVSVMQSVMPVFIGFGSYISQIRNCHKYLVNLVNSYFHIIKAISHYFKQIANALVHSCKLLFSLQLYAISYIISCLSHVDQNALFWFSVKLSYHHKHLNN